MNPYEQSGSKKEQVQRMFDGIAPRYDLLNRTLSFGIDRRWRKKLVGGLRTGAPTRILDIATGTGDVAFAAARACPGAKITGLDLSEGMLAVARRRATAAGVENRIEFLQGEAERLPFADGSFDAVTASFGVRNFHDIPAGLSEMARVLASGGGLYILEFSTPGNRLFGALYRWYFHRVLPVVGGLISKDTKAYGYLPSSVDEFPAPNEFCGMIAGAGFRRCRARRLTNGVAFLYTAFKE
ncbi:MAG: bifunctional demethylmenaquinone methyltransferase/2-methoxy-6-polyprenyl-1,4-benzoquinol methylase UbiE [Rikenellaceae bacterium]|nr:bifunctional demethylmenaquinone methyltransferase/2-methoxy-6-polyprenyl-1,4-benzoquinol methylase UbiE [Rikenellaceae bacterium]